MLSLHQSPVRGREITVQLQSTDALLCVTNLPHTLTAAHFQELARLHGNLERCFLVYSDRTGHSKGYGFVECMKKDSASRARCALSGLRRGGRVLVAEWVDTSRLTAHLLHSKCLRVDRLPSDLSDSDELSRIFGGRHKPVFCQLAQDEDSHTRGFAVLEYEMAEQAEAALTDMDRQTVRGQEVHVSLCPPGAFGRSTLAALIAAQGILDLSDMRICVLSGAGSGKAQSMQPRAGVHDAKQYSTDITAEYTQQYGPQYSQEVMQPWYQHHQAQEYARTALEGRASEYGKVHNQAAGSMSCVDYSTYAQAASQYYSQPQLTLTEAHAYHRDASKNQTRRQKCDYSQLPAADLVSDRAYVGHHSQNHHQDYSIKRRL